jgi:hypothetical protein
MMNHVFKVMLIATVVTVAGVAPQVSAVESTQRAGTFCSRLTTLTQSAESALAKKTNTLGAFRNNADTKRTEQRATVDGRITTKRKEADQKRDDAVAKLLSAAKSESEKQAIQAYTDAVKAAVAKRRTTNDAAQLTFRQGVDALVSGHRGDVDAEINTFVSSVKLAASQATSDCSKKSATAAATFKAAIMSAKSEFTIDRASDVKMGEQIKALAATRNAKIKACDATPKAEKHQAKTTLQAALNS